MSNDCPSIFRPAGSGRLLVVGDAMLDRTRWVHAGRADAAAATAPVYRQRATSETPGGAAYVAALLSCFGFDVDLLCTTGDDAEGRRLVSLLEDLGVRTLVQKDCSRPTTVKERIVSGSPQRPQVLARLDREATHPLRCRLSQNLLGDFRAVVEDCAGVVVSAYDKGVCTPAVLQRIVRETRQRQVLAVADPARTGLPEGSYPFDVLTPNRHEAGVLWGQEIRTSEDATRAGRDICRRTGAGACVVTLDSEGAVLTTLEGSSTPFRSQATAAVDATGAGDAFAATLLGALASGRSLLQSAGAAVWAASLQVQSFGTVRLGPEVLSEATPADDARVRTTTAAKVLKLDAVEGVVRSLRREGRRIVLTNGCFDVLHPGHLQYLEQAAGEGDTLIVAINTDAMVRTLKGPDRPIVRAEERAQMLAALAFVDYVVIFPEPTPHRILRQVRPDVLVKGGDYRPEEVVGREIVASYGGTVKTLSLSEGWSTTGLVERMTCLRPRLSGAG